MQRLIFIGLFVFTVEVNAQSETNQVSEHNQKIGEWVYYHPNGKIEKVCFFQPTQRFMTATEAFINNVPFREGNVIYEEVKLWEDHYEYTGDWEFYRIKHTSFNPYRSYYCYSIDKSIAIDYKPQIFTNQVGNISQVSIAFENLTAHEQLVSISSTLKVLDLVDSTYVLQAHEKRQILFSLTHLPGISTDYFKVDADGSMVSFPISWKSYHFSSTMVNSDIDTLHLTRKSVFYRTGDEAFLRIYDPERKIIHMSYSLAKSWHEFDFHMLKNGYYHFCFIDHKNNHKRWIVVKLEG